MKKDSHGSDMDSVPASLAKFFVFLVGLVAIYFGFIHALTWFSAKELTRGLAYTLLVVAGWLTYDTVSSAIDDWRDRDEESPK